jgi:F-type H+-transporting ATPase subunit b
VITTAAQKMLMEVFFMKISGIYRKGFPFLLILLVLICLIFPLHAFGSGGESGGGGVTVTPDGSVLIQIANFVFTIWVLNLLLYKPIRKILKQRKEKVDGLELSIETSAEDAREKDEAFVAGVKEARSRGVGKKNALVQEAADEEKSIIADINQKAQAELLEIRGKIKKEAEIARDSLQKEVDSFADQISEKILGRAV